MKKIISLLIVVVCGLAAVAVEPLSPHLYIYRNDGQINYIDCRQMQSLVYDVDDDGNALTVNIVGSDGESISVAVEVIDRVRADIAALPDLHFTLTDYPDFTDLVQEWGKSHIYAASLTIDGNGMYDDMVQPSVELRGRGNSTWVMPKKPYRFKLPKKTALFGLPKAKSFALIANYIDCTHLRNAIAFEAARMLDMPFTNHAVPVRVWLNGINKGLFMLTEKVGIGSGSVDIDENRGMMFELDTSYDEDYQYYYAWTEPTGVYRVPVMVKDPDINEVAEALGVDPEAYWHGWRDDFSAMADRLVKSAVDDDLSDVIDIDSAVDYFIVNNLAGNSEMCHPKSVYLYKRDHDDVYHFGPVWDFDWAYTYNGGEGQPADEWLLDSNGSEGGYSFLRHLLSNAEFQRRYAERWSEFVDNHYPRLIAYIDEYASMIEPAAIENGVLWPADPDYDTMSSYEHGERVVELKEWLARRVEYISTTRNHGLIP